VAQEPEIKVVDRRWWATGSVEAGAEDALLRKPSYVEELEQRLTEKDEQLREIIAKYKAAAQEFDESRVRSRRDIVKEIERGKRVIFTELLDVVDNLDRAVDAASRRPDIETLRQGVEMVREQFLAKLEGFGITRIPALGQKFDPARHEAATTVPSTDAAQQDRVVGVIREGYQTAGDVLRPAVVAVAQAPAPPPACEDEPANART
jgi:molecular chaperone GrpE